MRQSRSRRDRQCEIEARPKRECEIAESVAQSIKPAGRPQCPNRHPCEPAPQREIERQRARATNQQPEQENRLEGRPGAPPGEVLADAKDQKQRHRAGRQTRRKQQRRHVVNQRGSCRRCHREPVARIIIMIWWTNIAWLSQIRAISRRMA